MDAEVGKAETEWRSGSDEEIVDGVDREPQEEGG